MQPWCTPFPTMNRSVGSCVVPNIQWTWIVVSAEQKITSDGRSGRKSYGVASESLSSSLPPKFLPRVWQLKQGVTQEKMELACGWHLSTHLSTHMSFFFFTWTPGYDGLCLGIKDSHILWSLGGIPEFAIELGRKPRIGLESKGDGKSQGININDGCSQRNWKGGKELKGELFKWKGGSPLKVVSISLFWWLFFNLSFIHNRLCVWWWGVFQIKINTNHQKKTFPRNLPK